MRFTRQASRRAARAFTLVEMVVSMGVLGVISVAAGLSVTVLLRMAQTNRDFTPGNSGGVSPAAQAIAAQNALDMLDGDLRIATSIANTPLAGGGMQLSLVVPGRYAGDATESLNYIWNGPGASLMRQLNASTPVSIADNVQSLNLTTLTRSIGTPAPTAGSEQILFAHDGGAGTGVQPVAISSSTAVSQTIIPSLTASTAQWSITHLELQLQGGGAGSISIQLFSTDAAGHPLGLLAGASLLDAANLPGSGSVWTDVAISASGLKLGDGVCVVVSSSAPTSPASIQVDTAAADSGQGGYATSSGGAGGPWTSTATPPTMQVQLFGTVTPGVSP